MLLRRCFEHLKHQNWVALALELVVVVVGIFLAFQVDRWYESRRLLSALDENLASLSEDFAVSRDRLNRALDRQALATKAIIELTSLDADRAQDVSHEEFYQALGAATRFSLFYPVRRTYDAMIATGSLDLTPDAELRLELATYFAEVENVESTQDIIRQAEDTILKTYFAESLDSAAVIRVVHPEAEGISLSRDENQFRELIGDARFEGMLINRWHSSYDLINLYRRVLEQIDRSQVLIGRQIDAR